MFSRGFRNYGVQGRWPDLPKCSRCDRTIAACGDDHYVSMVNSFNGDVWSERICCWCVIELAFMGIRNVDVTVQHDKPSGCPARLVITDE